MKTHLLAIAISAAVLSSIRAETIVIRDGETGKAIAEVDIDSGNARFSLAGRTINIERKAPVMELRARKAWLPKVAFKNATLDEVASWLRRPGLENDEPTAPVINFVINDQAKRDLLITLHLEQVSLYDLLTSLGKKYGLTIAYDDHAITVTDPKQK